MRSCVGCRRRRGQHELRRVIRHHDGTLDIGRTLPGRGAWVCPETACWVRAGRRGVLEKALRGRVADGAFDALRARMEVVDEGRHD